MTLEFRILGPLEVSDETGHVALGGPKQRALLAVLVARGGRVVATDRLIDLLWGEEAPKTATASLQNAVGRSATRAGRGRARDACARIRAHASSPSRSTRAASSARSPTRGGSRPTSGASMLVRALALWRGPALAEFAFDDFAQAEIRRLEELRLVALEERIDADLELGRHGDVIGELEGLVAEHPLRETLPQAAHARAVSCGPAGGGARGVPGCARPLRRRARDRARPGAQPAPGGDPPPRGGARVPTARLPPRTRKARSSKALSRGRVVPVIGLDGAGDLAEHLASAFAVPDDRPVDLARVSQYVATMQGSGPLYDELHSALRGGRRAQPAASLSRPAPGAPARARRAAPAHRHDELRPRARARLRGGGRGARHRRVRRHRPASRPLLAPTARRAAAADRRPEHVRDRAHARAAHDPPEAPRRRRSAARARVGELRHHRGRLHRLPRPLGADRGRPGRARGEAAPEPLPLPRLRDGRLEPAADPQPHLGRAAGRRTARGRCSARRARSRRRSGGGSTSTPLDVDPQAYVELLERRLEAA